jgi:hypothetical protein
VSDLHQLIGDVDTVARSSSRGRERTLARITDLLVRDAARLGEEQVSLFDDVIGRFAPNVPVDARAALAERLSTLRKAPPKVIRALAFDEDIGVAGPVLANSACLNDQDLIEVAIVRGSDHMAAICERPAVSEQVSDILVSQGDSRIWRAIAGNEGAQFSPSGRAELLDRSKSDERLQDALGERSDLSEEELHQLVAMAEDAERERVSATMPPTVADLQAVQREHALAYRRAQDALRTLTGKRPLCEGDVAAFASKHRAYETISVIAAIARLPIPIVERMYRERDDDLLLVIGKAYGWSWRTVRAVLSLRAPFLPDPKRGPAETVFEAVSISEARRVLAVVASKGRASLSSPG